VNSPSWKRITLYTLALGIPSLVLLASLMLPRFLTLEAYRPEIIRQLERTSGYRATLGALRASVFPPSVTADNLVLSESKTGSRPVVSAGLIQFNLEWKPLLHGNLRIQKAVLERPRVFIYLGPRAAALSGEQSDVSPDAARSFQVAIHDGRVDLRGILSGRPIRWGIEGVEASLDTSPRHLILTGKPTWLGPAARLSLTYDVQAEHPLELGLKRANMNSLFELFQSTFGVLQDATLDAQAAVDGPTPWHVTVLIERLRVPALPQMVARGSLHISTTSVSGAVRLFGLRSPMALRGRFARQSRGWSVQANIDDYSPEWVALLTSNRWARALEGSGRIAIAGSTGNRGMRLEVRGSDFGFSGTRLAIPEISATIDNMAYDIRVIGRTSDGVGQVRARYVEPDRDEPGRVDVAVSSISVQDVMQVLGVEPIQSIGIESWIVRTGFFEGLIHPGGRVELRVGELLFPALQLESEGEFDWAAATHTVRLNGKIVRADLAAIQTTLGLKTVAMSGLANAHFKIQTRAGSGWLESSVGSIEAQSADGFIRAGKLVYRMAKYLNITNLLKPSELTRSNAEGIPYQTATASLALDRGMADCPDLKIRTPNMNIAAQGKANIPARLIDAKIQLQFMNTLKDRLSGIPLVKRIIKPDTGLMQVPLRIRGPWDNPEIN
jgi:hypothetical protein